MLDDGNQYVYGAGLASMKQGGNWFYYLADGLGSTMAVVDSAGAVQKSYQYDVYGEVTGGSGSLPNEFDFAGQQTDGTGLQYLRARYYDPETGVFLSREPMATNPGWLGNGSGYSAGDPARFKDPTGAYPTDERGCRTDDRSNPIAWGTIHPAEYTSRINRQPDANQAELSTRIASNSSQPTPATSSSPP